MAIIVYGIGPSRSFRVLWAAEEAGLKYEYRELQPRSTEKNGTQHPDYLKINPQGKVPAIQDGDFVLTESGPIVNYIAVQALEKNLIPTLGTQDYARYEQLCYFVLTELEQPLWTAAKHQFAIPEEYRVPAILEKTTAWEFNKAQSALLKLIAGREYAAGNVFSMADVLLAHTIYWAYKFKFEVDEELLAYHKKMSEREAYQRARAVFAQNK